MLIIKTLFLTCPAYKTLANAHKATAQYSTTAMLVCGSKQEIYE